MNVSQTEITTYGLISEEVYNTDYMDFGELMKVNGITYQVVDFNNNKEGNGLNALLLERQKVLGANQYEGTGDYVIAFRGTELKLDDIWTDITALTGTIEQKKDAVKWVKQMQEEYSKDKLEDGNLVSKAMSSLTLTGHSLGGILTQAVGAELKLPGYAYNPFGSNVIASAITDLKLPKYETSVQIALGIIYNIIEKIMVEVYDIKTEQAKHALDNIYNISYQDDGKINGDVLSNLATGFISSHLGNFVPIWGENVDLFKGHSIGTLNGAIAKYNELSQSLNTTYETLSDMFYANAFTDKDDFIRTNENIDEILNGGNASGIKVLEYDRYGFFIERVKSDPAYAYAFEKLNAFVVEGVSYNHLVETYNLNGDYKRHSDFYMQDRIDFILKRQDGVYYRDQKLDLSAGDNVNRRGQHSPRVIFAETNDGYAEAYGMSYTSVRVYGSDGDNILVARSRQDNYVEGGEGSDTITTGMGNDTIYTNAHIDDEYDKETSDTINTVIAGEGNDRLIGAKGQDILYGDFKSEDDYDFLDLFTDYDDYLIGGEGKDRLFGGKGEDVLIGGISDEKPDEDADYLEGGGDFDTYIVGKGDTIKDDEEGEGKILFNGIDLTGKKDKNTETGKYEDTEGFTYEESGDTLIVTQKSSGDSITIQNWDSETKKWLGIELGGDEIIVSISPDGEDFRDEGGPGRHPYFVDVSLSGRELKDGETVTVSVSGIEGSQTFESGDHTKTFTYTWTGDFQDEGAIDHTITLTPSGTYNGLDENVQVVEKGSLHLIVRDDDEGVRHDPLALDTNKDGFISTSSLEESTTYFDITGDGLRERVGWIKAEDALVAYDKNENGQIDGIDEVFGNGQESGFDELKRLIDSNHDNLIDRKDELFYRLQTWNDLNQDAKVQEGELQSLYDAGVTSIDLNYVSTNIDLNGNLLTEASKYTDSEGNKELAADIQLNTDARDTRVEPGDIPDFTIDEATVALPQFKGSGLVYNSFIRYNIDEEFKAVA